MQKRMIRQRGACSVYHKPHSISTVFPLFGNGLENGSVIGTGSVVTKDIPANAIAVGNPCRVLRKIHERDREYYYKGLRYDQVEW